MRLFKKRESFKNETEYKPKTSDNPDKRKPRIKRRYSSSDEDQKVSRRGAKETIVNLSNENTMSSINDDYIYCNEEDDDESFHSDNDDNSAVRHGKRRSRRLSSSKELEPGKKESNKEAATRYRIKKIGEKDKLFDTRQILEKENGEVKRRIELVQTEINYLKCLLVQMLLTRGVLNNID